MSSPSPPSAARKRLLGSSESSLTFSWAVEAKMQLTQLMEALGMPASSALTLIPRMRGLCDLLVRRTEGEGECPAAEMVLAVRSGQDPVLWVQELRATSRVVPWWCYRFFLVVS